jgi:DNA-directed RNA polymerase specialized sigma24 family protein
VLFYFNDLTVDEIADATNAPAGTVKSRLHAARQRLRTALAPPEGAAAPMLSQPRGRTHA